MAATAVVEAPTGAELDREIQQTITEAIQFQTGITRAVQAARVIQARRGREVRRAARAAESARAEDRAEVEAEARRQCMELMHRVRIGAVGRDIAVGRLEMIASGLRPREYDEAIDMLDAALEAATAAGELTRAERERIARAEAEAEAEDLTILTRRAAIQVWSADGRDAETRRAIRRDRRSIRGIGEVPVIRDTTAGGDRTTRRRSRAYRDTEGREARRGDSTRVTRQDGEADPVRWTSGLLPVAYTPSGDAAEAVPAGPVTALRPVWAVTRDGVVLDAAEAFAVPLPTTFGPTADSRSVKGRQGFAAIRVIANGGVVVGRGGWRQRITPTLGGDGLARVIGPDSPWRVPSVPSFSPTRAEAIQQRATRRAERLRAELEAEERRRNPWAGEVQRPDPDCPWCSPRQACAWHL